jgi:hypothetical protein
MYGFFCKFLKTAYVNKTIPQCAKFAQSGTDGMIFKIFSPKKFAKKLAFLTQNKAKF